MKKLLLFLGVLVGLLINTQSYALTARDSTMKTFFNNVLVSSANNANTAFSTNTTSGGNVIAVPGVPITGIGLSGGGSGGTVTLYDANTAVMASFAAGNGFNTTGLVEVGPQEVVFEATVGSNTTTYIDLSASPISTRFGVVAAASSTSGVVVYTSSALATNQ